MLVTISKVHEFIIQPSYTLIFQANDRIMKYHGLERLLLLQVVAIHWAVCLQAAEQTTQG